jgi:hypothetical protein
VSLKNKEEFLTSYPKTLIKRSEQLHQPPLISLQQNLKILLIGNKKNHSQSSYRGITSIYLKKLSKSLQKLRERLFLRLRKSEDNLLFSVRKMMILSISLLTIVPKADLELEAKDN